MNSIYSIQRNNRGVRVLSFLSVLVMIVSPMSAGANIVWEYDFDDGFPTEWSVTHGTFEIVDGAFTATECVETGVLGSCLGIAWVNSSSVIGTWSFDYYQNNGSKDHLGLYFASEGKGGELNGVRSFPLRGYCLFIFDNMEFQNSGNPQLQFGSRDSVTSGCPGASINDFELTNGWHTIEISRNINGEMALYIDGDHIASVSRNISGFETSEEVSLAISENSSIDNFIHTNTIDVTANLTKSEPTSNNGFVFLVGSGLIGLTALSYVSQKYYKKKELLNEGN